MLSPCVDAAKPSPMDKVLTFIPKSCSVVLTTCAHYCTSCKLVDCKRCCTVVIKAGICLTITQETRSHLWWTQRLQINFKLKRNFESTGASLFRADAPTRLCFSALQPSSIHLLTAQSTEEMLLKVLNDVYLSSGSKNVTLNAELDILVVFDTLNIPTIKRRLEHSLGGTAITLRWIKSYLSNRAQL